MWNPRRRAMHSLYYRYTANYQVGAIKWAQGANVDAFIYWTAEHGASTPRVVHMSSPEPMAYWKREPVGDVEQSGEIAFSLHDAGFPGTVKDWRSVEIYVEDTNANRTVAVHYRTDLDEDWTLLGTVTTTVGYNYFLIGAAAGSGVMSEHLQLRLVAAATDGASGYVTVSPAIRKVVLRGVPVPVRHQIFTVRVKVEDGVADRNGAADRRTAQDISSDLIKLFSDNPDTSVANEKPPMQLVDLVLSDGQVHACIPISYQETLVRSRVEATETVREDKVAVMRFLSTSAVNQAAW